MARARLELLSELLTEAYERSEHALLRNLEAVSDSQRSSPVHPGGRSIAAIVAHAGACKWVYENNAFGDGALGWDAVMALAPTTRAALLEWLGEGHTRLVTSIQGLDDDIALEEPRMTHWGTRFPHCASSGPRSNTTSTTQGKLTTCARYSTARTPGLED